VAKRGGRGGIFKTRSQRLSVSKRVNSSKADVDDATICTTLPELQRETAT
jgi:hypothetical protein